MTVKIKVKGFEASITRITSHASSGLTAIVEFKEPVQGLKSFGVGIPPQEFTREELVSLITKEAEKRLERYFNERRREEIQRREWEKLEKLAKEMNALLE